ncbi:MAG: FHA domain-containing protein [Candidatus Methanofastidiosia archaeon]
MCYEPIDIDLILSMDTTGSMAGNIASAKSDARRVIDEFSKDRFVRALRVGFIAYRDHGDEYVTKTLYPVHDSSRVERFIRSLKAFGGGDAPEAIAVAMRDATNLFGESHDEKGKILVWYCDAPPHGKKYNCGLADTYPEGDPSGIDFETEMNNLKEMNVLIYAIPFGIMASISCFRENLDRWTDGNVYAPLRRSDSLAFTDHILHAAVLECILRREVGRCILGGMSHPEIETHIIAMGLPKRDIIVEGGGTSIRTEERRVTRMDIRKTTVAVESTRLYAEKSISARSEASYAPVLMNITIECVYPFRLLLGSFSLDSSGTLSIGRHHFPETLPGREVISRNHFTVTPLGEGTVVITDTSTNGLSMDGVRLSKNVPQTVRLPAILSLAGVVTVRIG